MADFSELFRTTEEQITAIDAVVTNGQIPAWLQGSFIRLGPGIFDFDDFVMNHWFDGYAVVYKFDISNGKVKFCKRFLQSDAYKKAMATGRPVFTEYGTKAYNDPEKNLFSRIVSTLIPDLTDNDAINLFTYEDALYAATETYNIRRIDINNLETCEKVDLNKLVGIHLSSPHSYQDKDGNCYTIGTSFTTGGKYHVVKLPPAGSGKAEDGIRKASILTDIPSSWSSGVSYYHSFGMSEKYIVFIEQPLILNLVKLLSIQVKGRSLRECMDWHPEECNRFIVVDKKTGKIVPLKYRSKKPFFVFHHINTYEEDDQLVVDVIAMDSPDIVDQLFLEKLRNSDYHPKDMAIGRRFILPLPSQNGNMVNNHNLVTLDSEVTAEKTGKIIHLTPRDLSSQPGYELPVINKQYFGKKYRYYYSVGMYDPGEFRNSVLKVDAETGETKTWKENEYTYPGEPQFVSRPGAVDEDDGVLLTAVTDVRKEHPDFLLVLNAEDLTEIARAEVNVHIPNVLHGIFVSQHQ
ncbi:beta,beta-carotene 15,15'-dioxygenase [Anabrus simplex]|uniref:beta,beta-carotene 15,15'-dioxygenase n=1 Tax=Anabrus simplex TaxID=316456 RepID=UPI0035A3705D